MRDVNSLHLMQAKLHTHREKEQLHHWTNPTACHKRHLGVKTFTFITKKKKKKKKRNKVLSINLLNNNQNTQTILRIGAPNKTGSFWSKQDKIIIFSMILARVKQKKKEKFKVLQNGPVTIYI